MFCKTVDDQHELTKEMVYQLWAGFAGFRHESSETTWVYTVALHTAQMHYRKRKEWFASFPGTRLVKSDFLP